MSIFDGLNKSQLEAVKTIDGPVRLVAGPGSGKTRTITHRVAHLIEEGVEPSSILAITFTNKAAKEMEERIYALTKAKYGSVKIATYHAFCAEFIREHSDRLEGFTSKYRIMDGDMQKSLIKRICKDLEIDNDVLEVESVREYIAECKSKNYSIDDAYDNMSYNDKTSTQKAEVYEKYKTYQLEKNFLDFDDLLINTVLILNHNDDVRIATSGKYQYIHVDEFQDTNDIQLELVKLLSSVHNNVLVVGDADQTIYTWRGAKPEILLKFNEHFANTKTILLEQNYRSTGKIVTAANNLIKNNMFRLDNESFTTNESGSDIQVYDGYTEDDEASWIASKINNLLESGCSTNEILVLFRSSFLTRPLEEAFLKSSIPFRIIGSVRFFERAEVRTMLDYIRLVESTDDDDAFENIINVPKRSIGEAKVKAIRKLAEEQSKSMFETLVDNIDDLGFNGSTLLKAQKFIEVITSGKKHLYSQPAIEIVKDLYMWSGLQDMLEQDAKNAKRVANINELFQSIENASKKTDEFSFTDYLNNIALDSGDEDSSNGSIAIMTIHKAKGLEADNVFVFGVNDGVLPSWRSSSQTSDLEEERRLAYVAITRAKKNLYITFTRSKPKSRFLYEIGTEGVVTGEFETKEWTNEEVIYHDTFGKGTIIETSGDIITIDFGGTVGLKTMLSNHKSLKRVK